MTHHADAEFEAWWPRSGLGGCKETARKIWQAALRSKPTVPAASRDCETADGVAVTPGHQVWVFGSIGLTATTVAKPVTNYLLWSSPIPVSKSYSSKEAALAAQAKRAGA